MDEILMYREGPKEQVELCVGLAQIKLVLQTCIKTSNEHISSFCGYDADSAQATDLKFFQFFSI